MDITIKPEIKSLIPSLTEEEYNQLEQNIIKDGCREPLVIWNDTLIDGHHRYSICQKHNIPYSTNQLEFNNQEDVEEWILLNHLGRRNLTTEAKTYLIGKLYSKKKKDKNANLLQYVVNKPNLPSDQNDQSEDGTAKKIADQFNVSEPTVRRAEEFSESIDLIREKFGNDIKNKILTQQYKTTNKAVKVLAKVEPKEVQVVIDTLKDPKYKDLTKVIAELMEKIDKKTATSPVIFDGSIIKEVITSSRDDSEPIICPAFWNFKWADGCNCARCFKKEFKPKSWKKIVSHVMEFWKKMKTAQLLNTDELIDGLSGETDSNSMALSLLALVINSPHKILFLTGRTQVQHLLNIPADWKEHAILAWSLNADRWLKDGRKMLLPLRPE